MTKPLATPRPFNPEAASVLLDALRDGHGLAAALTSAGLSERLLFAWFAHAGRKSDDPALEPYRRFQAEYLAAIGVATGS